MGGRATAAISGFAALKKLAGGGAPCGSCLTSVQHRLGPTGPQRDHQFKELVMEKHRLIFPALMVVAAVAGCVAGAAQAQSFTYSTTAITNTKELRYMGGPLLSVVQGQPFVQNQTVAAAFLSNHPCPSNPGAGVAQCFGWELVHVIAIACGGNDSVFNLMWMPNDMAQRKRAYETSTDARAPYAMPYTSCRTAAVP